MTGRRLQSLHALAMPTFSAENTGNQLDKAQYRGEWRAKLMRDDRDEFVLEPTRLLERADLPENDDNGRRRVARFLNRCSADKDWNRASIRANSNEFDAGDCLRVFECAYDGRRIQLQTLTLASAETIVEAANCSTGLISKEPGRHLV